MFRDGIVKIGVRALDDSGSIVSSRFDYQLACSFLMLLEFSKKTKNIVLMLEKIDDFVIVENEGEDDEIIYFFQVKTQKNTPFTVNAIINNKWLKKQADNYVCFDEPNVKNILLTNLGIEVNHKIIDDVAMMKISSLEESNDKEKLLNVIKETINATGSIDDFYLMKCTLTLDAFETQLSGEFQKFLIDNKLINLTLDAVEAAYRIIYQKLILKRDYVLSKEEKKDPKVVFDKKSFDYNELAEILQITKEIEIPTKSDMSNFHSKYNLYLGHDNIFGFLTKYDDFKTNSAKYGNTLLTECYKCVIDNQNELDSSPDVEAYSNKLIKVFDNNPIIKENEFYDNYKIQIAALFVYKKFNG